MDKTNIGVSDSDLSQARNTKHCLGAVGETGRVPRPRRMSAARAGGEDPEERRMSAEGDLSWRR
jgi:hypothetical protein